MKLLLTGAALVLAVAVGGYGWSTLTAPCGWLARDGCEARLYLRNLTITGDTMTGDAAGQLWLAGADYQRGRRADDRPEARIVIVRPDLTGNGEELRIDTGTGGRPDQLRISPAGDRIALSCNALYVCDLPGGNQHDQSRMIVYDASGERLWFDGIPDQDAPPDADGRAFDLAWSQSGGVLFAHLPFAAEDGSLILTRQLPIVGPTGRIAATATEIAETGVTLPALPVDFIPFSRLQTALSADGSRIAILARRFSGPGVLRAIIWVIDLETGAIRARHDIAEDLAPVILWHPNRDAVIVAANDPPAAGAGTELRFYRTGEKGQ